ncbi:MAG TPA: tRNA (adenosine(37)-N6)-dimethylallyltransferase MiaA [Candidatus Saccharimonadales bacterium]|nr:tRNA (adenosine(37)-N6)-dimethylallyltransferase MiaA [Candidatus Saccharimonadales bacterium]
MSKPIIAIVGPTASGKTALGIEIAKRHSGEIICADSRTVYKGMDIGTAKPTAEERAEVPHHLLDVVTPDQVFTASEFQNLARDAISDIESRGKLAIIVGGTGLYVDAVLYDYNFPPENQKLRAEVKALSKTELQERARELEIELNGSDFNNPLRLARAIETVGQPKGKSALRPQALVIGLDINRPELEKRIRARITQMLKAGFMAEVNELLAKYGSDAPGLNGIGYRAFAKEQATKDAVEEFVRGDLNLAKRQMTWFKRNGDIHWVESPAEGLKLAEEFLSSRGIA